MKVGPRESTKADSTVDRWVDTLEWMTAARKVVRRVATWALRSVGRMAECSVELKVVLLECLSVDQ